MERGISRLGHWFVALGIGFAGAVSTVPLQAQEMCGSATYPFPYTDVSGVGPAFCPGIMEAYVTGISKGTSSTTFSPNDDVPRVQMTTFLQRTVDQVLTRGSRRAALKQWWTAQNTNSMQTINVGGNPQFCAADGTAIWISIFGMVGEVQANTGTVLGVWPALASTGGVLAAAGKIFVTGSTSPGSLYVIDPTLPPPTVTVASTALGNGSIDIAFDGTNVWTANPTSPGSVSIISPQSPYSVNTVTTGFNSPRGFVYDGAHIWVTDGGANTLLQLDGLGNILQTVAVGSAPGYPAFDGTNIWVPNFLGNSVTVVQASTGNIVATINTDSNNKLDTPTAAVFDGERVLVTNLLGNSVTVFKAADLSFIANVQTGTSTEPRSACSDGINFWVPLSGTGNLLRF